MAEKLNIHQRLAAVMADVTYIQKEQKRGMQYTITSHDKVTAKVRPALLKAGIVYYPVRCDHIHNGNRAECSMTVRFANVDQPDDFIDVPTFGYGIDTQDKGPGKAMSYAVKYALLKALGLETGDDADHDNLEHDAEDPAIPRLDHRAAADAIITSFRTCEDISEVASQWSAGQPVIARLKDEKPPMFAEVEKAKDEAKARLQPESIRSELEGEAA